MADALELLADVQLGDLQIDVIPGETKGFTLTEPEDEDQNDGSVERFAHMPGWLLGERGHS